MLQEARNKAAAKLQSLARGRAARKTVDDSETLSKAHDSPPNALPEAVASPSNAVAEMASGAHAETLAMFYINLVILNAHTVAKEIIREKVAEKVKAPVLGKIAGRAAARLKGDAVATMMIGKVGEKMCDKIQAQMAEAAGITLSTAVAFSVEAEDKEGAALVVLSVSESAVHVAPGEMTKEAERTPTDTRP